jgi:hypothetical protein
LPDLAAQQAWISFGEAQPSPGLVITIGFIFDHGSSKLTQIQFVMAGLFKAP